MRSTLITAIPDEEQAGRCWHVVLNCETVDIVHCLIVHAEDFGTLAYGRTLAGYDGWSFHERGGGGVAILPFAQLAQGLVVGVVSQDRHNQGGNVLNAPRGFLGVGETHGQAARRELREETRYLLDNLIDLGGEPGNPNSTFFETASTGEGSRFFALRVLAEDIEQTGEVLRLRGALVDLGKEAEAMQLSERISRAIFIPWYVAARLGDMYTNAAVARLLAYLENSPPASRREPQ